MTKKINVINYTKEKFIEINFIQTISFYIHLRVYTIYVLLSSSQHKSFVTGLN